MRTRFGYVVFIIAFWLFGGFLTGQDIRMRLPVKWLDDRVLEVQPIPGNFELSINGVSREIQDVIEYRDILKEASTLRRNFVVSFHIREYTSSISEAVAYFVYQVLNPGDHLIVLSPLKSHYMVVGNNKERVIVDMEKFLKPDCESFRQYQITSEKQMKSMLYKLNQVMEDKSKSSNYNVQRFKDINIFLNVFPLEMRKYCQSYVIPRVDMYDRILKQFFRRGGIRWWIHFHQREPGDLLAATRRMIDRIKEYFKDSVSHFSRLISSLENELKPSNSFPSQQLLKIMVGENVCYNVLFFGGFKNNREELQQLNESDLINKMGDVARDCGGRLVVSNDPKSGIKEIENHVYNYVELVTPFIGRIEPKSIGLTWKYQNKLVYKKEYTVDEIKDWIDFLEHEELNIKDFLLNGRRISFSISRFKKEEKVQSGILNVRICLRDQTGTIQYLKERTLRATEDTVGISIELPQVGGNVLDLKITVLDLVANNQVIFKKTVRL